MASKTFPEIPHGATYQSQLRKLSEENPDKHAYVFLDKDFNKTIFTRKDVWDNSRKYAAILRRHGIKKGDIVCNTLVNSPERLLTALGTIVAGAITMHGQVFLADGEDIIHNCRVSKCKAIIIDPGDIKGAWPIFKKLEYTDEKTGKIRYTGLPDLTTVLYIRVCFYGMEDESFQRGLQCLEEENEMFEESNIREDDIALVFSTSGTTGFSKQVPHTHRSCLIIGKHFGHVIGIESEHSRFLSHRSLGWMGGFPGPDVVFGATRILIDVSKGTPEKMNAYLFKILNDCKIDCGFLLPSEIEYFLKRLNSGEKLQRRLQAFGIGGMPLTKRILKAIGAITDAINIVYGGSEVGLISILHLTAGSIFEDFCAGVPFDGVEIKVVDKDYIELPRNKIGELAIQYETVTPGYLNEPERTRRSLAKDGYFLIGDNGYIDERGHLYVIGRQAHAIHKGPFIHYPGWIESRVLKCQGVEVKPSRVWK